MFKYEGYTLSQLAGEINNGSPDAIDEIAWREYFLLYGYNDIETEKQGRPGDRQPPPPKPRPIVAGGGGGGSW